MMSFVDYHEVEAHVPTGFAPRSTQPFKGQEWQLRSNTPRLARPHIPQGSRRHYHAPTESRCDGQGNERLSHSDFVAQQRSAEFVDRRSKSRHRGDLVWVKLH